MMVKYIYFSHEEAIEIHDAIINNTGGLLGILNNNLLISTLEHLKNDDYYPNFEDKLTHLFYSINKNHCFQDGNKRSCVLLCAYFLEINYYGFKTQNFIRYMENIAVDVSRNIINRELLFEIIECLMQNDLISEEIQLKILHAKQMFHSQNK